MGFKLKYRPCKYVRISQPYKTSHKGIDLAAPKGRTVVAAQDGRIVAASKGAWDWSYGNEVAIYHGNGNYTNYAHLSKILVKRGDYVTAGTPIGEVGNTGRSFGNHLHFEVHKGKKWNRVNPWTYMASIGYAPEINYRVLTNGSNLYVRDVNGNKIGKLPNKTPLHVVSILGDKALIDYPANGYVAKRFIKKV